MKKPLKVYISATSQNEGKTVVSLGLICALKERFKNIGFIKPVGQRYVWEEGEKVDEDALLIREACQFKDNLKDMSPIAIERGFTQKYILQPRKRELVSKIRNSFKKVSQGKDFIVIEGTGHVGVGAVFDLSNAKVAKVLNSKVLIISEGGIGRPIDEIVLNKALFEKEKVKIAGVIINKVKADKYTKISKLARLGLKKKGLELLGVIPYQKLLLSPTVEQILKEGGFELIGGNRGLDKYVEKVLVGAMAAHDALNYFSGKSLVITPGDREDIILAVLGFQMDKLKENVQISGIVLTGGLKPNSAIIDLVKDSGIPLLLSREDTYTTASKIHDLIVKIEPQDKEKIKIVKALVEKYIDIDKFIKKVKAN